MPLLVYTLLRILLVVAAGGLLYLLGLRGLLLVVVAVVLGALLSYALLGRHRNRAVETLQAMTEREPRDVPPDADARAEDAEIEASRVEESEAGSAQPEKQTEDDAER